LIDKVRAAVEVACREDGLGSARIQKEARNQKVVDLVLRHACGDSSNTDMLSLAKVQLRDFYRHYNLGKQDKVNQIIDEHSFERIMKALMAKYQRAPEGWEQQLVINRCMPLWKAVLIVCVTSCEYA
jgi:hypothetical protein